MSRSTGVPFLAYTTEVRTADGWTEAPELTVHLDWGGEPEGSLPAELSWRHADGGEATITFDEDAGSFHGHRRAADASTGEYRGVRNADPAGIRACPVRAAGQLPFVPDDGHGTLERITWRDRTGTFASVDLRRDPAHGTVPLPDDGIAVIASGEYPEAGEGAANLLSDGTGKWLTFADRATLDFRLPEAAVVTAYELTSANDCRDRDPRDWRLRGSADGHNWFTLDIRDGEGFPLRSERRVYAVANSKPYRWYRLDISRNQGRQEETQLQRVRLRTPGDVAALAAPVPVEWVTASSEHTYAGEVAAQVLDAGPGKWLGFGSTAWLEFTLREPAAVTAYTLTSANDHCSRDPRDWELQGSDDGGDWVTLDRRTAEMFPERYQSRQFTLANSTPYARYRLVVLRNAERAPEVQLTRVELFAGPACVPPAPVELTGVVRRPGQPATGLRSAGFTAGPAAPRPSDLGLPSELAMRVSTFWQRAYAEGVPPEEIDRWLALARPCVVLSPAMDGPVVGHFGSPMLLPPDMPVPGAFRKRSGEERTFEQLVATIDLAALPEDVTNLRLPRSGRLLLTAVPEMDASEDETCRIGHAVHLPADAKLEERRVISGFSLGSPAYDIDFEGELRGELRLHQDLSLPGHWLADGDPLLAAHPHARVLVRVWRDMRAEEHWWEKPVLWLGGWATDREDEGDPVARCAAAASRRLEDGAEDAGTSSAGDWLLLAQWHPRIRLMEAITVYWAIAGADLEVGDFSGARVTMYANP